MAKFGFFLLLSAFSTCCCCPSGQHLPSVVVQTATGRRRRLGRCRPRRQLLLFLPRGCCSSQQPRRRNQGSVAFQQGDHSGGIPLGHGLFEGSSSDFLQVGLCKAAEDGQEATHHVQIAVAGGDRERRATGAAALTTQLYKKSNGTLSFFMGDPIPVPRLPLPKCFLQLAGGLLFLRWQ